MFLDHITAVKKWLARVMLTLAIVLGLTLVVGGLAFNLDVPTVAAWFVVVIVAIFALVFLYALITFIFWFLFGKPCPFLLCILGVAIVIGVTYLVAKILGGPVFDIGTLLDPVFAFMK